MCLGWCIPMAIYSQEFPPLPFRHEFPLRPTLQRRHIVQGSAWQWTGLWHKTASPPKQKRMLCIEAVVQYLCWGLQHTSTTMITGGMWRYPVLCGSEPVTTHWRLSSLVGYGVPSTPRMAWIDHDPVKAMSGSSIMYIKCCSPCNYTNKYIDCLHKYNCTIVLFLCSIP